MFKTLPDADTATVEVIINGVPFRAPTGCTAAAALLLAGAISNRTTPVTGAPRAPYCMMGVCFDCLVHIDGQPNRQACLVTVAEGMQVRTPQGARALAPATTEGAGHGH